MAAKNAMSWLLSACAASSAIALTARSRLASGHVITSDAVIVAQQAQKVNSEAGRARNAAIQGHKLPLPGLTALPWERQKLRHLCQRNGGAAAAAKRLRAKGGAGTRKRGSRAARKTQHRRGQPPAAPRSPTRPRAGPPTTGPRTAGGSGTGRGPKGQGPARRKTARGRPPRKPNSSGRGAPRAAAVAACATSGATTKRRGRPEGPHSSRPHAGAPRRARAKRGFPPAGGPEPRMWRGAGEGRMKFGPVCCDPLSGSQLAYERSEFGS